MTEFEKNKKVSRFTPGIKRLAFDLHSHCLTALPSFNP